MASHAAHAPSARRPADKVILWMVILLAAGGVVAVYSAIAFLAATKADGDTERYLFRHVSKLVVSLVLLGVFSVIDYHKVARYSRYALLGSLVLLVAVRVVGTTTGGATRWLTLGGVGFQPSDLARVSLVVFLASLLASKQAYIRDFSRGFAPVLLWMLLTTVLIGVENLSTAAVTLLVVSLMCFVGRVRIPHLVGVASAGALLAYLMLLGSPGRAARIEAYTGLKLFPNTDAAEVFSDDAEGYQARQARIAFAMGGLTGTGPGKSVQRDFLPAPYNDFIFAIVAEEYGMVGAFVLLAALTAILLRGYLYVARPAPDPLGLLLAVGITTMIVVYGFVHAGVASGLLPVTGLPMPFVSYGGTSMITNGIAAGILLNISRGVRR